MANKYLDYNGLAYFWEKIKATIANKVDKVDGKGLSSNDYTSNEKTKLAGIATGAQVNVLEGVQKNGQTVTITNKIANISVPTKTSDITNDSGFITSADVPEGAAASTTTPKMNGTAAVGTQTAFARGDHVHPVDTSRSPVSHASSATTYGVGTGSNYGHVKLSDATNGTATAASGGTAASPKAVADALQAAKNYADGLDTGVSDVKIGTTSVVSNGVAVIPTATTSSAGVMSSTDKTKLEGIEAGAEVNQNAFGVICAQTNSSELTPMEAAQENEQINFLRGDNIVLTVNNSTIPNIVIGLKSSPALTGTPTAPTATAGTNSTQIATTAFVASAIQTAQTGAAAFQGTAPTTFAPTNYKKGYYWVVGAAGTYVGETCEPGDMIFAVADYSSTYKAADFNVIQTNLDIISITNAEIDTIVAS